MFNATIAGNVGRDAETKTAGQGVVTTWSVAVEQRGKDGKVTTWVDCNMWGTRGEKVAQYIQKGGKVCVSGELTRREHDGKTYLQINVSDVTLMGSKGDGQQQSQSAGNAYAAAKSGQTRPLDTAHQAAQDFQAPLDDPYGDSIPF